MLTFILFGCSNEDKETNGAKTLSLEEQITNIMSEHELKDKEIIDYDMKKNFIYVIFKQKNEYSNGHYPDLVVLENQDGELKWIAGPNERTMSVGHLEADVMIFGMDKGPSVSLILPGENPSGSKIKDIKVLDESAKAVTYVEDLTEDFSKQYTYWISYTEEEPTHEDFEYIMQ